MLTPIEIRQQTFNKEFRGYNRVEVDAFLQEVAKMMEQQLEINRNLKEELEKDQGELRDAERGGEHAPQNPYAGRAIFSLHSRECPSKG